MARALAALSGCETKDPGATSVPVDGADSSATVPPPVGPGPVTPAASPRQPAASSAAEGQDGVTTIDLPGHPDMTPEQCAAWWAGVSVERLELMGPDEVRIPPEMYPPVGVVRRSWKIAPAANDGDTGAATRDPVRVSLAMPYGLMSAQWPEAPSHDQDCVPAPAESSLQIAREFMQAREFAADDLRQVGDRVCQSDREERPIGSIVTFKGVLGDGWDVMLFVDIRQRSISHASLARPRPLPAGNWVPPRITLEEAREALEAELRSRHIIGYQIRNGHLVQGAVWQKPDNPLYYFPVYHDGILALWYVDATSGHAVRRSHLGPLRKWETDLDAWREKQRRGAGPALPTSSAVPSAP